MNDAHLPTHPTLTHPRTGAPLRAVGIVAGRPVWPILGGDGSGDGGEGGGGEGGSGGGDSYTPPASQADLDRIIEQRLARERQKYANHDTIVKEHGDYKARLEQLEADLGTEADKAAKKARDEERARITAESVPRIVRSEFKAEAKNVLTDEQLKTLLEDLDLTKYVDANGDPDEDKIKKKIAAFAPSKGTGGGGGGGRDLGQGNRGGGQAQPGDQGRAMAEKRFGSKNKS